MPEYRRSLVESEHTSHTTLISYIEADMFSNRCISLDALAPLSRSALFWIWFPNVWFLLMGVAFFILNLCFAPSTNSSDERPVDHRDLPWRCCLQIVVANILFQTIQSESARRSNDPKTVKYAERLFCLTFSSALWGVTAALWSEVASVVLNFVTDVLSVVLAAVLWWLVNTNNAAVVVRSTGASTGTRIDGRRAVRGGGLGEGGVRRGSPPLRGLPPPRGGGVEAEYVHDTRGDHGRTVKTTDSPESHV